MSDLPPVDPRDLRNRGQQRPTNYPPSGNTPPSGTNYPPSGGNYPPVGSNYPPSGGNYPPAQPDYPPQGYPTPQPSYPPPAQPSYPPSGSGYPPAQPAQPSYPPPQPSYPPAQPSYPPPGYEDELMPPANPGPALEDLAAPDLRRNVRPQNTGRGGRGQQSSPPSLAASQAPRAAGASQMLLSERQVEALGWGVCVILFGVSILLLFTGASSFLVNGFPLLGGSILLISSLYQQMHRWRVSFITWLTAIGLVAFSITRFVALADGVDTGIARSIAYFFGVSIIIAGMIVLVRIFRAPRV